MPSLILGDTKAVLSFVVHFEIQLFAVVNASIKNKHLLVIVRKTKHELCDFFHFSFSYQLKNSFSHLIIAGTLQIMNQ